MQLIFLGPPGAGKGTQAQILANIGQIPHISTGDILRANVAAKSDLGLKAQGYMDRGELVPDQVLMDMVRGRLQESDASNGWILDGFPRTIPQATFLDELLEELTGVKGTVRVVNLDVPDEILVVRLLSRGRKDDSEDTIRRRLEVYREQTAPLIGFYGDREQLITIDGDRSLETVTAELKQLLETS